jgi:hypothetical protein
MGYDCTLHVIDENRIRERFADRLINPKLSGDPFDNRADARELWQIVRKLLKNGPVKDAASAVAQLAILFSAAELPYHTERGFCLSLWPDFPPAKANPLPRRLIGDPAALFSRVVDQFPKLKGHFPVEIESNFSTGLYVPREKVPELLKWARKCDATYDTEFSTLFRGLILVLEHAVERNLGYWEATDLPLEMRTIRPVVSASGVDEWAFPHDGYAESLGLFGDSLFVTNGLGDDCSTTVIDVSKWPPTCETIPEYSLTVARSAKGKWLTVSADRKNKYLYLARVRDKNLSAKPQIILPEKQQSPNGLSTGGFVGERVVAFARYDKKFSPPLVPLIERAGKLVNSSGVKALTSKDVNRFDNVDNKGCVVTLNNGTDVIIWNGTGYT